MLLEKERYERAIKAIDMLKFELETEAPVEVMAGPIRMICRAIGIDPAYLHTCGVSNPEDN